MPTPTTQGSKPAARVPAAGIGEVALRPLRRDDRDAFIAAVRSSRASVERWIPLHEPGESDGAFFERELSKVEIAEATGRGWRRIAVTSAGAVAGCFCLNAISRGLSWDADALWWVAEGHRGRGVGRMGVASLLAYAFAALPEGLGLTGVHAGIDPANTASVRLAEACGFRRMEGQRSHLKIGERWVRHDLYLARPEIAGTA